MGGGGPMVALGPGAHNCHPRSGSRPTLVACGQEVSPVTGTLQLGAGGACAGKQGGCRSDQPAVAASRAPSHRCLI